ncbi:MAG: hypothetical protein ACXWF6_12730, partial [Usitatibacter sp.]
CGYRQPTTTQVGTATIFFNTERSATVTLLGVTLNLVRYDWSGWGSSSRDALLGEWVTTTGETSFPVYFGERVTLYAQGQSTAGPYAGGNRTGDSAHLAVGIFDVASGKFSILLDSSTSYWDLYIFDLKTFSRAEGQNWVYLKSSSPSGNGLFFVAHRTKSGAQVRTGIGPGINKLAPVAPIDESTIDAMMAVRAKAQLEQGAVDPLVVETARKLEALLR